ncbi:MAG: methyltransferase domain-containing protein [Clostridia bacterium]|nr:methyltransferase domain-containing protein [Clostridia bacterium]
MIPVGTQLHGRPREQRGLMMSEALDHNIPVTIWGQTFEVRTHPSLFSPRYADRGTLAMMRQIELQPDDTLLDLGCGWGLVGLAAAGILGVDQVVLIDNDPVAVRIAAENAAELHLENLPVIQADGPRSVNRLFSHIVCHPPYHTDFSVARHLIEDSYEQLLPDGQLWLVVKRLEWYRRKMSSVFGGVRVIPVDGYFVLMSRKSDHQRVSKQKKTTRKHLKKLAARPDRQSRITRTEKKGTGR